MSPYPPYRFGKGPIAVALEDYLTKRENVLALLGDLQAQKPLLETGFAQHLLNYGKIEVSHLGEVVGTEGPDEDAAERAQRFLVYGSGLTLVAQLALDLKPDDDPDKVPEGKQPHAVEIFWGCGQPYNQAWVSTRPLGDERRLITLVIYSTIPATTITRDILKVELDEKGGVPRLDLSVQELVVCLGDRGDDGPTDTINWFRPPTQMGIPRRPA
jgi:hypothetical protein